MERKKYPITPEGYKLFEEIGQGVSASVYRAICIPFNEIVAIKVLDFERKNSDVVNISREAQTMILVDHPNVLKAHCSFVNNHDLWVVMPFMAGGSCLHILKAAYPDGFQEAVIATVLREVLRGLDYLQQHGHIHRDVKAGNILVDGSGAVKLGDFGVSACLFDSGDRQRSRNTFVGTPCWMAPEVMEQSRGYDFKADIWSFGITALELAHGHAPFSKYPPMKVLLMTLQNAPPGLDYERDRKFSKSFKQMIAMCLVKNPSKRPSAAKLLKHPFFKHARSNDYIARSILEGLPSLGDRIKALKMKEAEMLAQKKMPDGEKEEISQNEYKRGISGWNFDIEDMKAQASLIQDVEETLQNKDQGESSCSLFGLDGSPEKQSRCLPSIIVHSLENDVADKEVDNVVLAGPTPALPSPTLNGLNDKQQNQHHRIPNGAVVSQAVSDAPSESISRIPKSSASNPDDIDEKSKVPVVQQRGRFKVTSENVDLEKELPIPVLQKSHSMQVITQAPAISLPSPSDAAANPIGCSLFPQLHCILQTNILQRENILSLMKQVSTGENSLGNCPSNAGSMSLSATITEKSLLETAHEREKELLQEITDLQWRLVCASDELQRIKMRNAQV